MRWILFALLAAGAVAYARWVYRSVDLPVPGARRLWPVRAAALVLVLLLLFDPVLPWGGMGSSARWVLLDTSLSMTADGEGEPAWAEASARAEALRAEGWRVVTFGTAANLVDDTTEPIPDQPSTRLSPALALAAEGGAREVRVLTDMRLEDEVSVRSALDVLPLAVSFERFGGEARNAGILAIDVADRAGPDMGGTATVEIHGGSEGDTLSIEIFEEDGLLTQVSTPAPGPGLRRSVEVELPPAAASGLIRYEAALDAADDFAPDDRAVTYGRVGVTEEGGVVLVSFAADWEPRYLLPVLGRSTGLDATGYIRAGADRFVPMGPASARGEPVDSSAARQALDGAALVVLHGLHDGLDAWGRGLLSIGPRRIIFPSDPAGAAMADVATGVPRSGEWYVSPELPPSPIAGELAGAARDGLPPLRHLMVPTSADGVVRPLLVQLRGGGPAEGPVVLRIRDGGRDAVVLASGFWRWAARESARDAYDALWAGVAGWLLRDRTLAGSELRPARWAVPRGEDVDWLVPPSRTGYGVRVRAGEDQVLDTTFAADGVASTGPLAPGRYRYAVVDPAGDSIDAGRFDVNGTTADMVPTVVEQARLAAAGGASSDTGQGGRPLRTLPWPYLVIIGLLCAEWFGRRRSGLR